MLHFYQPANLNLPFNYRFMQIVVQADEKQKESFLKKVIPEGVRIHWNAAYDTIPEADAYFDLCYENEGKAAFSMIHGKPVFVNAVTATCAELPAGSIRINAWDSFFQRDVLEIAAADQGSLAQAGTILKELNWNYQVCPDTAGMIAARVIAMIINEAYFALGDEVSSKKEIDTAMKLGTNYPYGPFEWSEIIGLKKIHTLLQKLARENPRYAIAPAMKPDLETNTPVK